MNKKIGENINELTKRLIRILSILFNYINIIGLKRWEFMNNSGTLIVRAFKEHRTRKECNFIEFKFLDKEMDNPDYYTFTFEKNYEEDYLKECNMLKLLEDKDYTTLEDEVRNFIKKIKILESFEEQIIKAVKEKEEEIDNEEKEAKKRIENLLSEFLNK